MANDCSRLMKEALDNYLGIDMRYKLDDTLASLGKQKFSAKQLEGYLLKKGVSPKEIKQSGIFDGMEADNRAISAEDWLGMSGKQKITVEDPKLDHYSDITLGRRGVDNPTYKELLSTVKAPKNNVPREPHFNVNDSTDGEQSLLGWRRTHVQEIEGKPTLVLNEFQSDWAQTERAGRGTFESNAPSKPSEAIQRLIKHEDLSEKEIYDRDFMAERLETWLEQGLITQDDIKRGYLPRSSMSREKAEEIYARHVESFFKDIQEAEPDKTLSLGEIQDKYWDDWVDYRTDSGPAELIEANKIIVDGRTSIVADFPMSEIKHHQFQIVGAIDDALKQGINTIVIPIQRENELAGTEGVTKFYESLNQKVLPDIRKKLEKQGMRIKVDKTAYKDKFPNLSQSDKAEIKAFAEFDNLSASTAEVEKFISDLQTKPWFSTFRVSPTWPFTISLKEMIERRGMDSTLMFDLALGLRDFNRELNKTPTDLWRLTVEEIPNKKVNWDVYGLIGALGLTSMLSGEAEAKELPNIISPKTEQVESQVPATRQEAEQGTLQRILSQNKVAPLNEPKGVLQQYRELGLISQQEEDSYDFKKDHAILDDYRVDMKRQMPKTILEQEGNNLSAHRPTKRSGWTIGRGYDLTGRKLENVIADFKEAGISEGQARAFFNHKPIKINAKQSKALGDIAWREKVDTARRIGLPIDKLNREGFLKVMSLVYRGDIVKGEDSYRGKLYDLAKKGDIKAIDRFVLNDSVKILKSNVLYNRWKKFDKS